MPVIGGRVGRALNWLLKLLGWAKDKGLIDKSGNPIPGGTSSYPGEHRWKV